MHKKYLVLITLPAMMTSTIAMAETKLKPFAIADIFYEKVDTGDRWRSDVGSSGYLASRFGIEGSTDVGRTQIGFMLEAGFNPSEGTLTRQDFLWNRQAWGSLKGTWGEVRYGIQNSLLFINSGRLDASASTTHSSIINNFATYTYRTKDTVSYISPKLGPWQFTTYYGKGRHELGQNGPSKEFALTYDKGPWQGVFTGQTVKTQAGDSRTALYLGGNYKHEKFTYYLATHAARWTGGENVNSSEISVKYDLTEKDIVGVGIGHLHDRTGRGNHAEQAGVIYRHTFNKHLIGYGGVNFLNNHNDAMYRLRGAATGGTAVDFPGADPKGIQVGLTLKL